MVSQVTLTKNNGKDWTDKSARRWEAVRLDPPVCTSKARINVESVYSSNNNGFIEVQFHADSEY